MAAKVDQRLGHFGHGLRGNGTVKNTPKRVSAMGAFSVADRDRPSTSRAFRGSMSPSSHSRVEA